MYLNDALDGLARNPALPADLVRRLVPHRHGGIAGRPDLPRDVVERIIADDDHVQVRSLARNRTLPERWRLRLAGHPDPWVRGALACAGATGELAGLLAADPDAGVRADLVSRGDLSPRLLVRLAADPEPKVRAAVARSWPQAPDHVRRALLTDPDDTVRATACSHHRTWQPPPDLVPALLADPVTRAGAVRHAVLDRETALRLARDPDVEVRARLAEHPDLPPDLRDLLGADPYASVRLGVFTRPDTPEPLRSAIHAHIRSAPDPMDLLHVDDEDEVDRELDRVVAAVGLSLLRLDWVTADPLPHVASPYPSFRASAARASSLPDAAVFTLLTDEDCEVAAEAAKCAPHLVDAATAERVDREYAPFKHTSWRPADVLSFPPRVLHRLATDADPRMRQLAPRDPDLPAELAARLACDTEPSVRGEVAHHPNLPTSVLLELLFDEKSRVVERAAGSPWLPREWMELLLAEAGL